jgi:dihydrofolate reductase
MRKLIYSMGVSLDGFIAGRDGEIDWSAPDEELHRFHNRQTRELGAHLCGRRLYETMLYWETAEENPSAAEHLVEFARIWNALPKIVISRTLEKIEGNARLVRDNVADEVAKLKEQPGKDLAVGGAGLAATCMKLGLIDEYRLFVSPVVLGGGTPYFPALDERIDLELVETQTFASRVVYVRYRVSPAR